MKKQDPRVKRTRKNIMDTFMSLLKQKEFNDISISDITTAADINRSTFYYHFLDKYDLKDSVQREILATEVFHKLLKQTELNETTIAMAIHSIINCHRNLSQECQRSYIEFRPKLDAELRERLKDIFQNLLELEDGSKEKHESCSIFWSWGIYGLALNSYEGNITEEDALKQANQLILHR